MNIPDRLRGFGIEHTLKVVEHTISNFSFIQAKDDVGFRNVVKRDISRRLADEVYKVAVFSHMIDHEADQTKVIGRVVVMTTDQLKKLIEAAR